MLFATEQVRQVARLARLRLSAEEVELYGRQLTAILEYVEQLRRVDTGDVEAMVTATGEGNVFRADEPRAGLERADALRSAPRHDGEHFSVPPVLEQEG